MIVKYKIIIYAVLFSFLCVLGCGQIAPNPELTLAQKYQAAITDAASAEAAEIYGGLAAIVESNTALSWEGEAGNKCVKVVTWTSWTGYNDYLGQSMTTTQNIWVTPYPEVINFCIGKTLTGEALTLRLEQLLGVPADSGKILFVEIWADPDDLFRPSPDPEITDQTAQLDFSVDVSDEHVAWFNDLKSTSYGDDGYPWTRLGYTYDWGSATSEVGLSEFVIKQGISVEIHSITNTDAYCP